MATAEKAVVLDTTDVDRWVGKTVGGGQLKEPVTVTDIRRWAQGMQNPNPLHYDDEIAERSPFGRIVAPQSFTICCDVGHGATPAIVGSIPGTHMIFGGDEWWFGGARIYPGDQLHMSRRFVDYKVSDTKFAGPTMFSRGETVYVNQRGDKVAKQWSTAVRYLAEEARKRGFFEQAAPRHHWRAEELAEIDESRLAWIRSRAGAQGPAWDEIEVGQRLPRRPIGPHSLSTFATEWRSYIFTVWGSNYHEGYDHILDAGWLREMDRDMGAAQEDPSMGDGLYHGPSRGHTDEAYAKVVGMPRAYGYGASMGAWVLDYVSHWAGDAAVVHHSAIQYRFPAFEGDLTNLDGEVSAKREDATFGANIATVEVTMTTQEGAVMAKGPVEVEIPER